MRKYDAIIIGAGPMGIFTAYELMEKAPDLKILLVDKGNDIYHRNCPIIAKKIKQCPKDMYGNSGCKPACSITCGFGGAGAYSDGKFNITNEFGGWMGDYMEDEEVLDIEKRGIAVGLKLLRSEVRHLGTEINLQVLKSIFEEMKGHIEYAFSTEVTDIVVEDNKIKGVILNGNETVESEYVIIGVGRGGSNWQTEVLSKHGVKFHNNRVDIGVRVETNDIIMSEINKYLYEGKFIYNTSVGTQVRTFCSNPSGHVVVENWNGIMVCNGHAYHDTKLGSNNTNFALLVSHEFEEPFHNANEYAIELSHLANKLSGGGVVVQKFGDIIKGRRSTAKRINEGFVKPTLKEAVPGDLGLILPYNTMKSLIEMIHALDAVTPGIANDHTLFYGVEAKFYSDRAEVTNEFETSIKNLFVGGDGAGITRGLAQAGANGVKIARVIAGRK